MNLFRTAHFKRNYAKAPEQVRRAFDKQSLLLLQNLHHPSLRAKKYDESRGSGRHASTGIGVFYFFIQDDAYLIVNIIPHPK